MKTTRRTEITIETDEVLVLRRRELLSRTWCDRCSDLADLVSADQAAIVAGVSSRAIHKWIDSGKLHFTETPEGLLLVCLNSVPRSGEAIGLQANSTHAKSGGK